MKNETKEKQPEPSITIEDRYRRGGPAPLYYRYPGREPQPAILFLDCGDGTVSADSSPDTGSGVSPERYYGVIREYGIPASLKVEAIDKMFSDPVILNLLERIYQGTDVEMDAGGTYHGVPDEDAKAAEGELSERLSDYFAPDDLWQVWDAEGTFCDIETWDLVPEGKTLEAAAEALEEDALRNGVYIEDDVLEYLEGRIKDERGEDDDKQM